MGKILSPTIVSKTEIAPLHPDWVARGLVAAYTPQGIARRGGVYAYSDIKPANGIYAGVDNSGFGIYSTNSFFVVADLYSVSPQSVALGRVRYNGVNNYGTGILFVSGDLSVVTGAGTSGIPYLYSAGALQTKRHSYAAVLPNGASCSTCPLYRDAELLTLTGSSGSISLTPFDSVIDIGKNTAGGNYPDNIDGRIEIALHFNVGISADTIKLLHSDPWQVLSRRLPLPIATRLPKRNI